MYVLVLLALMHYKLICRLLLHLETLSFVLQKADFFYC